MADWAAPDKNATVVALLVAFSFCAIALLTAPFIEYGEGFLEIGIRVGRHVALGILPWIGVWAAGSRRYPILSLVWAGAGVLLASIDLSSWFFPAVGGAMVLLALGVFLRPRLL